MFTKLKTQQDLDVYMETIQTQNFACIYKHSATCGMSATALKQVKTAHNTLTMWGDEDLMIGLVVVQDARSVSNAIAEQLEVKHESPQFLIFKDGKLVDVLNHLAVSARHIQHVIGGGYNKHN